MPKEAGSEGRDSSFDLERLRRLLHMMEKYGATEVNLQNSGESWKIRRGPREIPVSTSALQLPAMPVQPVTAPANPGVDATAPAGQKTSGVTIDAPAVGTFYSAASPDDPPFVTIGSEVRPDTTVCVIEAMKVFNQIPAEVSGKIVEILVQNGDPVEFGQPLFRVQQG